MPRKRQGIDCELVRTECDIIHQGQIRQALQTATHQVSNIIPDPEYDFPEYKTDFHIKKNPGLVKKVEKEHKATFNRLVSKLVDGASKIGFTMPEAPYWYVKGLNDEMQAKFGQHPHPKHFFRTPQKARDSLKYINILIDKEEKQALKGEKELAELSSRLNYAFIPVVFQDMAREAFGIIKKFVTSTINFQEQTRTYASATLKRVNEAHVGFKNFIDKFTMNNDITEDMVMGGFTVFTQQPDFPLGRFKGTVEIDNEKKHILELDGEEYYVPEHHILRDDIIDGLKRKYQDELVNEMMSGDTRHITWSDEPTAAESASVVKVLIQMKKRKELEEAGTLEKGESERRIHEINYKGVKYEYVMVESKSPDGQHKWKAFITRHTKGDVKVNYFHNKNRKSGEHAKDLVNISDLPVKDGFYQSPEWSSGGPIISSKGKVFKNSVDKQPIFFERMKDQPYHPFVSHDTKEGALNVWQYMTSLQDALGDFADDVIIRESTQIQNRTRAALNYLSKNPKVAKALGYVPSNDEQTAAERKEDIINQIFGFYDIKNALYTSKQTGHIYNKNSFFMKKKGNYFPWMWEDDVTVDMLDDAIENINLRNENVLSELELTEEEQKVYEADWTDQVEALESVKESILNKDAYFEEGGKVSVGTQTAMTKHRKLWTDPSKRMKQSDVLKRYIDKTVYGLSTQVLYVEALESLVDLAKTAKTKSSALFAVQTDFIMERLKLAINDPTAKAGMPIGKNDWNYDNRAVADGLNKLMKYIGSDVRYTPRSAAKLIKTQRGLVSGALLGYEGALVNKSQITNSIVNLGFTVYNQVRQARKHNFVETTNAELAGMDWRGTIESTGISQMVTGLADALAPISEVSVGDRAYSFASLIPGLPFGKFIPAKALKRFTRMEWRKNKAADSFIDKGEPEVDEFLRTIENTRIVKYRELKKAMKNIDMDSKSKKAVAKILTSIDQEFGAEKNYLRKRNIEKMRTMFIDLITTSKEDNTRGVLEQKFKNLIGRISDERLEKMIAYKLSWWFEGIPILSGLSKHFTFTEGELEMREDGAMMHLMYAYQAGYLGERGDMITRHYEDDNGDMIEYKTFECFDTELAHRIARNGVRNEYFGMTPVHLGAAFAGLGAGIHQYKGYPLQQQIFDYNVIKRLDTENKTEWASRIKMEIGNITHEFTHGKPFNPKDPNVDENARAIIRMFGLRGMATVGAAFLDGAFFLRAMYGIGFMRPLRTIIHGAQDPLAALALRMITNGYVYASMDDDEKTVRGVLYSGWDTLRLFMPIWIGLAYTQGVNLYRMGREYID